jgi:hypothetical protein
VGDALRCNFGVALKYPNILSLNQLSETLNKAEVFAAEIACVFSNIADGEEKLQVSSRASKVARRHRL